MKRRRALSLVEVILTMVILALAVPPLIVQIGAAVRQQEAMLVQQDLTRLAADRMWEIFADHADPTRGYAFIAGAAYPNEIDPGGLTGFARTTEVREVNPIDYVTITPGSGLKRFRITTSGPGGRTLTVESFVADVPGAAAGP